MKFSAALIVTFAALTLAVPTAKRGPYTGLAHKAKRAAVLGTKTYDELSISGGTAGDAEQEALDAFSALDLTDMANVDPADVDFLGSVNDIANDAETDAFNVAIEAAANEEEKTALENGKIKNKVLKLTATSLELQIEAAQGQNNSAKLAEETTKLNTNIALDKEAAGQASTFLPFDAST